MQNNDILIKINNKYINLDNISDKELVNNIIDNINKDKILFYIKHTKNIEYKKIIIDKLITKKNIIDILSNYSLSNEDISLIIENKQDIFYKKITNFYLSKVFDLLRTDKVPKKYFDYIYYNNYKKLTRAISLKTIFFNEDLFYNPKNKKISDLMYKTHKIRTILYILLIPYMDTLEWLLSDNVSSNLKKYINIVKYLEILIRIKLLSVEMIDVYINKYNDINIINKLVKLNKKKIIKFYKTSDINKVIKILNDNKNTLLVDIIIENNINKYNIINILERVNNLFIIDKIIKYNKGILLNIIEKNNISIFNLKISNIKSNTRNIIIDNYKDYFINKIKCYDKDFLLEKICDDKVLKNIKLLIIESFGYEREEAEIIRQLGKKDINTLKIVLDNYFKIKNLFKDINIDINSFIKYGIGSCKYSNYLNDLIYIVNNKYEEFIKLKKYLFAYYYNDNEKENMIYDIKNLLEIISNYKKIENLFNYNIENNIKLDSQTINNLNFFFKTSDNNIINNKEELLNYRKNIYNQIKLEIEKNKSLINGKDILNRYIFNNAKDKLDNIGGISGLKILQLSNKASKTIKNLSNELMLCIKIIDLVNNTSNINNLNNILNNIFSSEENFVDTQKIFSDTLEKIRNLYEIESKINLSNISSIDTNNVDLLNYEYMDLYGGLVYDLSDKNYILYAHVVSCNEKIDNLIKGISTPKSNFISLSPISYMGQKYYYNFNDLILAYDKIPTGSYICSSLENMGSNYIVKNNSCEVNNTNYTQRGILETSAVNKNNAESLLYREGLIPCGIILVNGKKPTKEELLVHKKYNLPFIITQETEKAINNPSEIFKINDEYNITTNEQKLNELIDIISPFSYVNNENNTYTGREIAFLTDIHALYTPMLEVLESIKQRGINEIYSLGDNIGSGPNPSEVIDLLDSYNVISISGNSEYYMTLGTDSFEYLTKDRLENEEWTYETLGNARIERLKYNKPSIDIEIGDKKVALCHFINDIRWDFEIGNNSFSYQEKIKNNLNPIQFDYTNSNDAIDKINRCSLIDKSCYNGFRSSKNDMIFEGKKFDYYDYIFQGHVHFESSCNYKNTNIHTLRGLAIGYNTIDKNKACYYVLKERKDGNFDIEKVYVDYNINYLKANIATSKLPHKEKILSFLS